MRTDLENAIADVPEQVRMIYGPVVFDCGAMNLAMGDLVLTDQSVIFLWYFEVHHRGSIGGLSGIASTRILRLLNRRDRYVE